MCSLLSVLVVNVIELNFLAINFTFYGNPLKISLTAASKEENKSELFPMPTIKETEWPTGNYEAYFIPNRPRTFATQSCELEWKKAEGWRTKRTSVFKLLWNLSREKVEWIMHYREWDSKKKILNSMLINLSTWHSREHPIKRNGLLSAQQRTNLHLWSVAKYDFWDTNKNIKFNSQRG